MNRLTRRAYTPGFNKISDDKVKAALRKFGYGELLDENEYTWTPWQNVDHQGAQGGYAHQVVGLGVDDPMLYFAELHEFQNIETGKFVSVIIVWRITDDEEIITPAVDVQVFEGGYAMNADKMDEDVLYKLGNNDTIKFLFLEFHDALMAKRKYISERNQKLIDDTREGDKNE